MAMSFTYDGVDFSTLGVTLARHPLPAMADGRIVVSEYGGRDGAAVWSMGSKARYWQFECFIEGSTREAMLLNLDAVTALLNSDLGDRFLVADCWPGRGAYARVNGPVYLQPQSDRVGSFQINWIIGDGCWHGTADITQSGVGGYVPALSSAVVGGNYIALPVWTVTGAGSVVTIANYTTGESITVRGGGGTVVIDSAAQTVRVNGETDMSGVDAGGVFPRLRAGVRNHVGVSGGTVAVTYRAVWK